MDSDKLLSNDFKSTNRTDKQGLKHSAVQTWNIANAAITSAKIQDASITNAKIVDLSASKISTGTLSANFINGGTLTIGGTGNTNGVISLKDASNISLMDLNNTGLFLYGSETIQFGTDSTHLYGGIGATAGNLTFNAALGTIMTFNPRNNVNFNMGAFSTGTFTVNGDFTVTGSKAATIQTSIGPKLFFAAESPDATWFFTFAYLKGWLFKKPQLDDIFLECTKPPYHWVKTEQRGLVQVWGRRK